MYVCMYVCICTCAQLSQVTWPSYNIFIKPVTFELGAKLPKQIYSPVGNKLFGKKGVVIQTLRTLGVWFCETSSNWIWKCVLIWISTFWNPKPSWRLDRDCTRISQALTSVHKATFMTHSHIQIQNSPQSPRGDLTELVRQSRTCSRPCIKPLSWHIPAFKAHAEAFIITWQAHVEDAYTLMSVYKTTIMTHSGIQSSRWSFMVISQGHVQQGYRSWHCSVWRKLPRR